MPILKIDPEDKKSEIRTKVWNYLADNNLASFPRPPHKRISNFRGADAAGDQIATLDIFNNAKILRIDPDKPLQQIRFKTLEVGKTLLVPTPRLRNNVFSKIVPPADCGVKLLRGCAARQGVEEFSEPVDIDDKIHVDLVVVGCVAVSSKGWRIGKGGGGLSDLEYAMMASMGVVDDNVIVVTMVHDCQVFDLSGDLFGPHDLPVDYIVTPTRVIKCDGNLPKPKGIIWSLLTTERLNHIPVLKRLRYREWKEGKNVRLENETEDPKELTDVVLEEEEEKDEKGGRGRGYSRGGNFRRRERRRKDADEMDTTGDDDGREKEKTENSKRNHDNQRNRFRSYRNRRYNRRASENDSDHKQDSEGERSGKENRDDDERRQMDRNNSNGRRGNRGYGGGGGFRRPAPVNRRRPIYDNNEGSVYVGSLPRSLRVSQFKTKVRERKVTPLRVLWRGSSGFAFLNFKTQQDAEEALVALEGLQISDKALRLEMARSGSERTRRPRGERLNDDQHDSQGEDEERAD